VGERTIDLSILMPVYDERATVERAIGAVLEMKLPASYELIVVDDGSRDGTRELLESGSWPEQVRLLAHDRKHGRDECERPCRERD
jgi:cellulose synthase/poly-beta-1,6-N-acetylglucosamine synthase-like glycosyltransferase